MTWSFKKADWVGTVTWNNPPENRIPFCALQDLATLLEQIGDDEDVKVVVMESALPHIFSAGSDLNDIRALVDGRYPSAPMNSWDHALLRLEDIPQPTIAFVDGLAANGGCEMTLACTFRVGTRRAAFSCREILTGSIPGAGATQRLPRIVGMAHASEMIMTGKTVDSKEARSSGLLQEIVKDAGEFRLWLERFSRPSRSALSAAKRAIIQGSRMTFAEGLRLERGIMENLIRTCDLGRSPPS